MKNTLNNLFLAMFLAFISQGIQAQFDDVYYDPSRTESSKEIRSHQQKDTYTEADRNHVSSNGKEYAYDDENGEWDNQDYYYTSRIKRFHRPYRGFDYYNGCYVDNYFYDPYNFNPYNYNQDIYVSSFGYNDYYRWRRWQLNPWHSFSYWNQWDWSFGWSPYPLSFGYNYCPYSGYYNNYWSYNYNNYPYNGGGYYNSNNNDNHPNGRHFGSRRFGLTNTSNRGPVRVVGPSPRVFAEMPATSYKPSPDRSSPQRIVRNADGDAYRPGPVSKPERATRIQESQGTSSNPTDRQNNRPRNEPKVFPGEKNTPTETRHVPRNQFKPERIHKDGPRAERSSIPSTRNESSPERSWESRQAPRESISEPRMERRQESNNNFRPRSESSGSRSEYHQSSGEHRMSHR